MNVYRRRTQEGSKKKKKTRTREPKEKERRYETAATDQEETAQINTCEVLEKIDLPQWRKCESMRKVLKKKAVLSRLTRDQTRA